MIVSRVWINAPAGLILQSQVHQIGARRRDDVSRIEHIVVGYHDKVSVT